MKENVTMQEPVVGFCPASSEAAATGHHYTPTSTKELWEKFNKEEKK